MDLEILKITISAAIPVLLFYFGYRFERNQNRKERRHKARIQFELEACFFGPQQGHYIAEIVVILHNKGLVRNLIDDLKLKVLGIEKETAIELRKKDDKQNELEPLAKFPKALIATDMLQKRNKKDAFFVEPGVVQRFTYVARIPEQIRFILVTSSFKYHDNSEHSARRVFELIPDQANTIGANP